MHPAYLAGQKSALQTLGMTKTARVLYKPSIFKRIGGWLKKKAPTKTGFRDFMIGDPKRFAREVASGHPIKGLPGKGRTLIQESFHAPDMLSKAMFYGLPAVETAGIALDDEGNKAQRIGGSLGGAALGLAAYRPLGMIGSIGADMVGRSLGGGIGKTVGHLGSKITGTTETPQQPRQPEQQMQPTRNLNLGMR